MKENLGGEHWAVMRIFRAIRRKDEAEGHLRRASQRAEDAQREYEAATHAATTQHAERGRAYIVQDDHDTFVLVPAPERGGSPRLYHYAGLVSATDFAKAIPKRGGSDGPSTE